MASSNRSITRIALLSGLAVSLLMMVAQVFFYPPLLKMPGGRVFVVETTALLVLYALCVVWATRSNGPLRHYVLLLSTPLGVIGGAIQIAHLTQEEFVDLGAVWNGITGFGLLFCTFALWGIAGYRTARQSAISEAYALRSGAMAGLWSSIVTMSMLVVFGFAVEFYLAAPKPEYVATWGEFKRSGWTDVHAFTIANTLDSAFSHLLVGPMLGAIFGGAGSLVARLQQSRQASAA